MISDVWTNQIQIKLRRIGHDILSGGDNSKLGISGLTDEQLNLKISIFNKFLCDYSLKEWISARPPTILPMLFREIVLALLDYINTILGSLSSAIPGAETIKEFKEMIHFVIEYGARSKLANKVSRKKGHDGKRRK